jgi:hypothetical protein
MAEEINELKTKKDSPYEIVGTKAVKLKDRPNNRRYVMVNLTDYFGQVPEVVIIEKVFGRNNVIIIKGIIKKPKPVKIPKAKLASEPKQIPSVPTVFPADDIRSKKSLPKTEEEKGKASNL